MSTNPAERLRERGLRVTAQRLAVLQAVSSVPHASVATLIQMVRAELGSGSTQAVYDVLEDLPDKRLLRRIQPAGSPARYENRIRDNHHHLICRVCDRIVDVDCALGEAPCLTAAEAFGFEIEEAEVTYWGWCPECVATGERGSKRTAKGMA